jgi:hypothetical protein
VSSSTVSSTQIAQQSWVRLHCVADSPKHDWLEAGLQCWVTRVEDVNAEDKFLVAVTGGKDERRAMISEQALRTLFSTAPVTDDHGKRVHPTIARLKHLQSTRTAATAAIARHILQAAAKAEEVQS